MKKKYLNLKSKVKANLILEHSADDEPLQMYITAAVSYAESYQHIPEGYYESKLTSIRSINICLGAVTPMPHLRRSPARTMKPSSALTAERGRLLKASVLTKPNRSRSSIPFTAIQKACDNLE